MRVFPLRAAFFFHILQKVREAREAFNNTVAAVQLPTALIG